MELRGLREEVIALQDNVDDLTRKLKGARDRIDVRLLALNAQ